MWFGSYGKVTRLKNNILESYTDFNGYPVYSIRELYTDSKGFLWIAHSSGVTRGDPSLVSVPYNDLLFQESNSMVNYPNPFHVSTTIQFELNNKSNVELSVYDSRGRIVSTPFNENLSAGHHELVFDGSKLQNGIYFCTIKTDESFNSIQMIKAE